MYPPPPQPWPQQPIAHAAPRRRPRVFLWIFLGIQALLAVLIVVTLVSDTQQQQKLCGNGKGLLGQACVTAWQNRMGSDLWQGLEIIAVVDVILGVGYGVYKLSKRQ